MEQRNEDQTFENEVEDNYGPVDGEPHWMDYAEINRFLKFYNMSVTKLRKILHDKQVFEKESENRVCRTEFWNRGIRYKVNLIRLWIAGHFSISNGSLSWSKLARGVYEIEPGENGTQIANEIGNNLMNIYQEKLEGLDLESILIGDHSNASNT